MADSRCDKKAAESAEHDNHPRAQYTYVAGHDGLAADDQCILRKRLLEENGIVIWRYHDHTYRKILTKSMKAC